MRAPVRTGLKVLIVLAGVGLLVPLGALAIGYGGSRTGVHGTVTRDGKPLEWPFEGGALHVIFVPEDRRPGEDPTRAETDRDAGTYRLSDLRPGRYLVAVHMFNDRHLDVLRNKFDPNHTPLRAEVTEDGQVIDIDLPKELPKDEPKGPPKGMKKGPPKEAAKADPE